MKTKKFIKKVNRYLVLSKEFEKEESDLFEDRAVHATSLNGTLTITGSCSSGDFHTNNHIHLCEVKTRAEVILDKARLESERSNRYDEYLKLRETISKYIVSFKL